MSESLLSPRERVLWALAFLVVAAWIVLSGFTSTDGDSALYAQISARLATLPASRWIAPEWWDFWPEAHMSGLWRENPAGVFLLPVLLGQIGVPPEQAAYVVGVGAGLASLLLMGVLIGRLTARADTRAALVLLQLMPMAFIFRIRSNHEYPMLVCLLVTVLAVDSVRRSSWWWTAVVAFGIAGALVVKGVFVAFVLVAAALWIVINPTRASGSILRPIVATLLGVAVAAGVAVGYDALYRNATGETFWAPYWARQLSPLTIATPLSGASSLLRHAGFYALRLLWHPAPWSFALVALAWRYRGRIADLWRLPIERDRRGLIFALGFALVAVVMLSPSSRFAERYAFAATFTIGAAGSVVAVRIWPRLAELLARLEAAIPAFPAAVWFVLLALRLVLGPLLPRT